LIRDLSTAEDFVNARGLSSDNQFAAMVSLTFNIGTGAFLGSTVLHQHKAGNFEAAADAFLLWDKAHINGKLVVVPGLLNRRIDERALYLRGGGTEGVAGQSLVMGQRRSLRCIAAVIDWRTWLISVLRSDFSRGGSVRRLNRRNPGAREGGFTRVSRWRLPSGAVSLGRHRLDPGEIPDGLNTHTGSNTKQNSEINSK